MTMKGYSRIIDKIESLKGSNGTLGCIDSKGLNCVIKPSDKDMKVGLSKDSLSYPVAVGEEFEFCGKIYYEIDITSAINVIYYHTL